MHLLAALEYDGTDFVGFQTQRVGRSVQEELERALGEFGQGRVKVTGGGRTDAGVHALGQTASFTIDWTRDLDTLQRALNAKLPRDLACMSVQPVPDGFSARYMARSRIYRYTIRCEPVRSPLHERYALSVPHPLDVGAMARAAVLLVGRRDFSAFGTPPHGANTVRQLFRAEVREQPPEILFEFEGNAFLYRMVRRMVGTLLRVGRGELDPAQIAAVLDGRLRAGDAAPAHGLTLVEIKYDTVRPGD